jgi:hypothetical protein
MTNKITLILIALALLAAAVGLGLTFSETEYGLGGRLLNAGSRIAEFLGLILLLRNGTTINTVYFTIFLFCMGFVLIGSLFKIMHWPGENLLFLSLIAIAVIYTIRFMAKKQKRLLDVLKLLWVITAYVGSAFVMQHWIPRDVLYIGRGLAWITIVYFIITAHRAKTLYQK